MNGFEDVLYGEDFADPVTGYAAHIDVDSVVDWYLVEELFRNQDSNFYSSVYVTWTPGDGFALGPVWDFDLSAGTKWKAPTLPNGWHTRYGRHWIARMFEDPAFAARVKARWAELRPTVDALVEQVPPAADVIRASALADWPLWPIEGEAVAGSVHADTFDGEVSFLRDWLAARAQWMSRDEVVVDHTSWTVRERARVVHVPVRILGGHDRPVAVQYAWRSGAATPGRDFTMTDGTLRFGPGEWVKTVPLRILGDRRPEGAETIKLALPSPDGRPRLGHPYRVALTIGASDQRPDALIRRAGSTRFVGNNVYNRAGRRQTQTVTGRPTQTRAFVVRVANDGNAKSIIALKGNRGGPGPRCATTPARPTSRARCGPQQGGPSASATAGTDRSGWRSRCAAARAATCARPPG